MIPMKILEVIEVSIGENISELDIYLSGSMMIMESVMSHFPNFIRTKDDLSGNFLESNKKFLSITFQKQPGLPSRGILETLFDKDEVCDAETVQELNNVSSRQFRV